MSDTLFTVPASFYPPKRESADRKRTRRNNAALERGQHPATGLPTVDTGEQCGSCTHCVCNARTRRRFYKCWRHRGGMTNGPATDIRVSWPACTAYEPADDA